MKNIRNLLTNFQKLTADKIDDKFSKKLEEDLIKEFEDNQRNQKVKPKNIKLQSNNNIVKAVDGDKFIQNILNNFALYDYNPGKLFNEIEDKQNHSDASLKQTTFKYLDLKKKAKREKLSEDEKAYIEFYEFMCNKDNVTKVERIYKSMDQNGRPINMTTTLSINRKTAAELLGFESDISKQRMLAINMINYLGISLVTAAVCDLGDHTHFQKNNDITSLSVKTFKVSKRQVSQLLDVASEKTSPVKTESATVIFSILAVILVIFVIIIPLIRVLLFTLSSLRMDLKDFSLYEMSLLHDNIKKLESERDNFPPNSKEYKDLDKTIGKQRETLTKMVEIGKKISGEGKNKIREAENIVNKQMEYENRTHEELKRENAIIEDDIVL